jgi:hypothetical protein
LATFAKKRSDVLSLPKGRKAVSMKTNSFKTLLMTALVLTACLISTVLFETQTRFLSHWIDDVIYDNKNHYLSCQALPTESVVRETLEANQDVLREIEQVNPEAVRIIIDDFTCPGKADLVIYYPSNKNRQAIEQILQGDTFFGIPYRLVNY